MEMFSVPDSCVAGELDYYKGAYGYICSPGDNPKVYIYKYSKSQNMFIKKLTLTKSGVDNLHTVLSEAGAVLRRG